MNITFSLFFSTDMNVSSSFSATDAAIIAKGKQPIVETPQVPVGETMQAPHFLVA